MTEQLIHKQMNKIQAQADGLTKEQENKMQGFKFRGIDDAYNYLHDIFRDHHVFSVPRVTNMVREERINKKGTTLLYTMLTVEYDFFADDGSFVTACVMGEAMDSGDKSCAKAMSIAHKQALFQITMLPTMLSAEPDMETHEVMPQVQDKPPAETPMAIRDQIAQLDEFRAMKQTSDAMNQYLDDHGRGTTLTYKQAEKCLEHIKQSLDQPPKDKK